MKMTFGLPKDFPQLLQRSLKACTDREFEYGLPPPRDTGFFLYLFVLPDGETIIEPDPVVTVIKNDPYPGAKKWTCRPVDGLTSGGQITLTAVGYKWFPGCLRVTRTSGEWVVYGELDSIDDATAATVERLSTDGYKEPERPKPHKRTRKISL